MDPEIIRAVIEQKIGDEKTLEEWVTKAKLSEKGAAAVKAAFRILGGFKDELPADIMTKLAELSGMNAPVAPPAPVAKKEGGKEEPVKKEEPVTKALDGLPEEVRKAIDQEREARNLEIKALTENNEKITKALEDEKDARNLAGWVEKTKTELSHYPGESSEEIAKSLHEMDKVNSELATKQFTSMKAASDALKGSAILKDAGSRAGKTAAGSAWEEIEKLAAGIVEKSTDSMSKPQAITHVLNTEQGAALYTKYEQEQGV